MKLLVVAAFWLGIHCAAIAQQLNISFILADDLGYNDLSCQGATKLKAPGNTTSKQMYEGKAGHVYFSFSELEFVNSDFTSAGQRKPAAPPQQLYDLAADLGETKNVYREHPDVVARLNKLFEQLRAAKRTRSNRAPTKEK